MTMIGFVIFALFCVTALTVGLVLVDSYIRGRTRFIQLRRAASANAQQRIVTVHIKGQDQIVPACRQQPQSVARIVRSPRQKSASTATLPVAA